MNPIALRLSAMAVSLEGCGMPEVVAALEIAEREIIRLEALIPPKPKHLVMICGVDCHPGDANCNNYCNLAPQKGPMADAPMPGPDAQQPRTGAAHD
jgi:hypothetical protein